MAVYSLLFTELHAELTEHGERVSAEPFTQEKT